jgi:hypothetical protein
MIVVPQGLHLNIDMFMCSYSPSVSTVAPFKPICFQMCVCCKLSSFHMKIKLVFKSLYELKQHTCSVLEDLGKGNYWEQRGGLYSSAPTQWDFTFLG